MRELCYVGTSGWLTATKWPGVREDESGLMVSGVFYVLSPEYLDLYQMFSLCQLGHLQVDTDCSQLTQFSCSLHLHLHLQQSPQWNISKIFRNIYNITILDTAIIRAVT